MYNEVRSVVRAGLGFLSGSMIAAGIGTLTFGIPASNLTSTIAGAAIVAAGLTIVAVRQCCFPLQEADGVNNRALRNPLLGRIGELEQGEQEQARNEAIALHILNLARNQEGDVQVEGALEPGVVHLEVREEQEGFIAPVEGAAEAVEGAV